MTDGAGAAGAGGFSGAAVGGRFAGAAAAGAQKGAASAGVANRSSAAMVRARSGMGGVSKWEPVIDRERLTSRIRQVYVAGCVSSPMLAARGPFPSFACY